MTSFVQPINREADLQAILENYEERINHLDWFIDAIQKDGIQNCWDARVKNLLQKIIFWDEFDRD
jgi:plasmid replication initiation protein